MKTEPQYLDVTLRRIVDFGNDTRHFELACEPGKREPFIPGQFAVVLCPKDGKLIRRAYSIASPPETRDRLELVVKRVEGGAVTQWFWTLREGDRFRVHAPFGKFILPEKIDFDILFVAVGTGIAPFRSMGHHLLSSGFQGKITLLFGTRYDDRIPYHGEFLELAERHPNFTYIPTISRPGPAWKGEAGYVQTKIGKLVGDPARARVYICGLNEMIRAVREEALKRGLMKEQIHYEKYD